MEILYEDNHLLLVNKPAGLPTMGAAAGSGSVVDRLKDYLRQKYDKPGNVYLGVVSRLDALVTGVVVFARTSKAAARLAEQFREGRAEKVYWALVEGWPHPAAGRCLDLVRKDDRRHRMYVTQQRASDAQEARLSYRTLARLERAAWLEVQLETGRKHQIRLQLAHRGHPVLGDAKYGARSSFLAGIALHSRQLSILHPVQRTPLVITAPLPQSWQRFDQSHFGS